MIKNVEIFDWQGTLVDVSGIRHLVETDGPKNFPEFHRRTGDCPAMPGTVQGLWNAIHDENTVVAILTGCTDDFRDVLDAWMIRNDVVAHVVRMRRAGDFRRDVEVKREMLQWLRDRGLNPTRAWDDNPNVAALWESEGIDTTVVPGWDTP